jgi:excisionase family DNA binding protein
VCRRQRSRGPRFCPALIPLDAHPIGDSVLLRPSTGNLTKRGGDHAGLARPHALWGRYFDTLENQVSSLIFRDFLYNSSRHTNMVLGMVDEILTIREVAELLKINEKTAYKLAAEGKIPGFKVGGSWRFERQEIAAWMKRRLQEQRGGGKTK